MSSSGSWLWYQVNAGFLKWVWKCFLLFHFWEQFEKDYFFFKCLVEFSSEAIWSWAFLRCEVFFITGSISLFIPGLCRICISSWLSPGRPYVPGNLLISVGYSIRRHVITHSPLTVLCLLQGQLPCLYFHFWLSLSLFCIYVCSVAKSLSILIIFSKARS